MKKPAKPVIKLSDSQFCELRFALEQSLASGFSSIASALFEALHPSAPDVDGDPVMPSKRRLVFDKKKSGGS